VRQSKVQDSFFFYYSIIIQLIQWRENSNVRSFLINDNLLPLVDPVELGSLVGDGLALLKPESNLLLGVLNGVGTVADVAADIDSVVATDGARGRGKGVGGTEDG
jgi:hypothetical protein